MVDTGFLKGRRVMAGKSQMAMAVALGVSLQTYMNKENGKFELFKSYAWSFVHFLHRPLQR